MAKVRITIEIEHSQMRLHPAFDGRPKNTSILEDAALFAEANRLAYDSLGHYDVVNLEVIGEQEERW